MATIVENDRMRAPSPYHPDLGAQIVTDDTVRQGPLGRRNLWIVAVGTIGAFLACAAIYLIWASQY